MVVPDCTLISIGLDVGPVAAGLMEHPSGGLLHSGQSANGCSNSLGKCVRIDAGKWIGWAEILWVAP